MDTRHGILGLFVTILCIIISSLFGSDDTIKPVTPNASPEAKALLKFMVSISGNYTLTGQHNFPNTKDRNSQFAAKYIGKTPAVWSTDWGFTEDGNDGSLESVEGRRCSIDCADLHVISRREENHHDVRQTVNSN